MSVKWEKQEGNEGVLTVEVDADTFNKALDEQRQWLADRDKQLDELPNEGSLAPVDRNGLYAELTLERCEELLKYFD